MPNQPIPFSDVVINDSFWSPKLRVNREISLPFQYRQLKESGRLDALRLEWTPNSGKPEPHHFWDSDTAKWVEAASYCLALKADAELQARLDAVIDLFVAAQQPDGYLNSRYSIIDTHLRWKNLRDNHELYCAGHLIEAAVAHFQALGSRKFLDVAVRFADYIGSVFGRGDGQIRGYCGHEEIELALVRLWQATGHMRFLDLASYFVEERGQKPIYFGTETDRTRLNEGNSAYFQAHLPVREQTEAVGHAVRAVYLYSAMADLSRELGDPSLFDACRRLWDNIAETRLYITGQIGSTKHGEAFTGAYDLPNEGAYCETCAGVGLIFWNHRMLQLDCDARYADQIEQSLYNGVLSGMALDGKSFFYQNPLFDRGKHRRQEWFGCSCCPSNLSRLLASLGSYIASVIPKGVAIHQYISGDIRVALPDAGQVEFVIEGQFPWQGKVTLNIRPGRACRFELALRIPSWAHDYTVSIDGVPIKPAVRKGYCVLAQEWRGGERIELEFSMPVERVVSNPSVISNRSQVALQRGPIVYCLEGADHEAPIENIALPQNAKLSDRFIPDFLGGVCVVEGSGKAVSSKIWTGKLYQPITQTFSESTSIRAIPYFAWANRAPGTMTVWVTQT